MKNVTVSLPDDVYRKDGIKAAERDTSVSALVREFLMQLGERDAEFDRAKSFRRKLRLFRARVHRQPIEPIRALRYH